MEYTEIQKLINSMGESKLTDLDIEFADGTKISMKKSNNVLATTSAPISETSTTVVSNIVVESKPESSNDKIVKSPMVGTFYAKSNPTSEPYVKEGDRISEGQTLCIIEAMKLMNEIESDYTGVVKKVLVEDGTMVEYGQPLFEVE